MKHESYTKETHNIVTNELDMGDLYGFVLVAVIPVAIIAVSWIIFIKRNHPFLKSRKPDFIIMQNMGVMAAFIFCSLYIGLRPNYSCKLTIIASTINISVIGLILLARSFEYCINFHIAMLKARFRFNEFVPTWSEPSWIYRNAWIANHKFIRGVLISLMILFTLPVFAFFSPQVKDPYDEPSLTCSMPLTWTLVYCTLAALIMVLAIPLAFFMRNSRDAYRLRHEKLTLGCVWLLVYFGMFIYPAFAPDEFLLVVPPIAFHLVGHFCTLCVSNFLPLFYILVEDPIVGYSGTYEQFLALLECPSFRNEFYKYLTAQLCGENLQFYETVQVWKNMPKCDENRRSNAQLIYDHFVHDDGLCQVNIVETIRANIRAEMEATDIPEDTFDEAYKALVQDMYFNSFIYFRTTREFAESATVELV